MRALLATILGLAFIAGMVGTVMTGDARWLAVAMLAAIIFYISLDNGMDV